MKLRFSPKSKHAIAFWAISIPYLVIWLIPLLLLAWINPFWFRQEFADWLRNNVNTYSDWRNRLLKPLRDKRDLFKMITESDG